MSKSAWTTGEGFRAAVRLAVRRNDAETLEALTCGKVVATNKESVTLAVKQAAGAAVATALRTEGRPTGVKLAKLETQSKPAPKPPAPDNRWTRAQAIEAGAPAKVADAMVKGGTLRSDDESDEARKARYDAELAAWRKEAGDAGEYPYRMTLEWAAANASIA